MSQPNDPSQPIRNRSYEWSDPAVIVDAALRMSGHDLLESFSNGAVPQPPIVATMGGGSITVKEPGRVISEFFPREYHYNPAGTVHGGVYATICDTACGCAVQSMLPAGSLYTSLDLTVKYLRPATTASGLLACEGRVVTLGKRTAVAQAELRDNSGKLYATAISTCLLFHP